MASKWFRHHHKARTTTQRKEPGQRLAFRPLVELLEARVLLASDFGDAPLPYKTLLAEGAAEHIATGPMLGADRDTEANGVHSTSANLDDTTGSPDDEDGVTFGTIRAGKVGATLTVNVTGGSAKLDAWIDFNRDGSWGGPLEQIADRVPVVSGNNTITFDVPSWASDGTAYARFRLSTAGNLGMGGVAADGEVEDYAVTVLPPKAACGCFSAEKFISISTASPTSVFAADVDGDGDTDFLIVAAAPNPPIAWYENNGSQNFTAHTVSTVNNGDTSVFAADVDGDGDTDVLSVGGFGKIKWYENDGSQNFTAHTIYSNQLITHSSVFAADVDGDGDTDVLSATGGNTPVITWYENDGSQNFTAHTITVGTVSIYKIFAADVDGDGDIDVLSASETDDTIAWYENDGSQNFTAHTITTAADLVRSVFAADVDGDGDTDVLSASSFDYKVAWYENDGSQNFTSHTISTAQEGATSVSAADMDGDGDTDVLAGGTGNGDVAWYENDGSQSFIAHTLITYGAPFRVLAADMDGDGDLDVLNISNSTNSISWRANGRSMAKVGAQAENAPDPDITPLPIPPPPGPIGQARQFENATVTEWSAPPLPNGRGSDGSASMAAARDTAFIDSSFQVIPQQRGVRMSVLKRLSGFKWTDTTPEILRLGDDMFAAVGA